MTLRLMLWISPYFSLRILLYTSLAFLLRFLSTFDSLLTSFTHLLDILLLFQLICLGKLGLRIRLLILLGKLIPCRFLFRFFRGCNTRILLALLNRRPFFLFFFENGVTLGLRCCIFGVVFFVDLMDYRGFIPNEGGLQLLSLLKHSFSLWDFKRWLLFHTNVILRLYYCIIYHINLLSLLDSFRLISLWLRKRLIRGRRLTLLRLFLLRAALKALSRWSNWCSFKLWYLFTHNASAAWINLNLCFRLFDVCRGGSVRAVIIWLLWGWCIARSCAFGWVRSLTLLPCTSLLLLKLLLSLGWSSLRNLWLWHI